MTDENPYQPPETESKSLRENVPDRKPRVWVVDLFVLVIVLAILSGPVIIPFAFYFYFGSGGR